MIVTAGKLIFLFSSERGREREEEEGEEEKEVGLSLFLVSLPRADDAGHRAVVRDLQRRRVGERGRLLQQPRAGARRGVVAVFRPAADTGVAAGRQKALERRGGAVEHPAARGHKLHRGLAFSTPLGPARDEEVVPSREEGRARDVGGVPADGAGGGEGLERGAAGGVDVSDFMFAWGFFFLDFKRLNERESGGEQGDERRGRGRGRPPRAASRRCRPAAAALDVGCNAPLVSFAPRPALSSACSCCA